MALRPATVLSVLGRRISDRSAPFLIGEIACAHQGSVENAHRLIDVIAEAKADAIQLQIFDPEDNVVPWSPLYPVLQELAFDRSDWEVLAAHVRERELALSIFAYDNQSLSLALALEPDMLKLNSSELSNPDMITVAAESGLPFTMGTGASTMEEVAWALDLSLAHGGNRIILMHGVQNFPTQIADAQIARMRMLRESFGALVGYADHTDAKDPMSGVIDLAAIGAGAAVLEKHVVIDRGDQGVDWQAALQPDEFRAYIATMRAGSEAMGDGRLHTLSQSDDHYRRFQKKSIVAARDLAPGDAITSDAVRFLRLQDTPGLPPSALRDLLGRRLGIPVKQYQRILSSSLEDVRRTDTVS